MASGRYSYDEMALIAGVATGTMKSRVWEARRQLVRPVHTQPMTDAAGCVRRRARLGGLLNYYERAA